MRKGLIMLFICGIVFVNGCKLEQSPVVDEGEFLGKVSSQKINIDNEIGTQIEEIEMDEKLALEIGNSILKFVYGEEILNDTNFVVFEIENKNIFVVRRVPKDEGVLGGDCSVAISKTDGTILKIWAGE